ncbi:hypothetical protein SESBI_04553 [Sesbania bispinosa]|nr:hypothetical protein SESBI_04553 [Sesbania bispinosa]
MKALNAGEQPSEFMALVGKELLFKVEKTADYAFSYDDSFKVRRVCDDKEIIKQFKKEKSIGTPLKSKFQPPFPDLDAEENAEDLKHVTPDGIDNSGEGDGISSGFIGASSSTNLQCSILSSSSVGCSYHSIGDDTDEDTPLSFKRLKMNPVKLEED